MQIDPLSEVEIAATTFGFVDLRAVKGLTSIWHAGPSTIGIDTLERSQGEIPEEFLVRAGLSDRIITYARSLVTKPIQFYSCFISHSSKDRDFAARLYADLLHQGVSCWFAPYDMRIGDKFRYSIDEAIRVYEKLLVIISRNSLSSDWVESEVEVVLEKEHCQRPRRVVIFPIRLDDAVKRTRKPWAKELRRTRHIGDFVRWREHEAYQAAFARLLRDLQAGGGTN